MRLPNPFLVNGGQFFWWISAVWIICTRFCALGSLLCWVLSTLSECLLRGYTSLLNFVQTEATKNYPALNKTSEIKHKSRNNTQLKRKSCIASSVMGARNILCSRASANTSSSFFAFSIIWWRVEDSFI